MDSEVGFRIVTVAPSSYWGGKAWLFMSANPVVHRQDKDLVDTNSWMPALERHASDRTIFEELRRLASVLSVRRLM